MLPTWRIPAPTVDVHAKGNAPIFSRRADTKPLPLENYAVFPAGEFFAGLVPASHAKANEQRDWSSRHPKVLG